MTQADLPAVVRIAATVHPAHPEDPPVTAERLTLYPAGCLMLRHGATPLGYAVSHPWRLMDPPALNAVLGSLPTAPDTFYLHDLALLPAARGHRAGSAGVRLLLQLARRSGFTRASLIAVSGSEPFWRRQGFTVCDAAPLRAKLSSYGAEARFMTCDLG